MDQTRGARIPLAVLAALAAATLAFLVPHVFAAVAAGLAAGIAGWLALRPAPPPPPPPPEARAGPEPGLAAVAASIDEPLLFVERQRVTHANAAAIALLGAHIVGEDVRLAIRHPAASARLSAPSQGDDGPVELAGLGGSDRHWQLLIHPLGAGGLLVRLADRTAARAAERMRVDFVANASHELRTPLATVLGFVETLQLANGPDDAATRTRFLATMMREAKRMQRLIEDLISLSRIEADRHSAPQAAVPLADLAAEVSDSIVVAQAIAPGRIILNVAPDTPPVAGDRAQLTQLLHNLIGNALKYGRAGSPVRIDLRREGSIVLLGVADEGEGIAREHLPRLTERFYRADPGRSRAVGGTGLGLAIVKHIVERHRGRLEIDSIVGRGTTISVRLPIAPDAVAEALSSKTHQNDTQEVLTAAIGDSERA